MERDIKIGIVFFLILLSGKIGFSQSKSFDKAIFNERFSKVERIIKRQVKQHKNGHQFFNGKGSGMLTTFNPSYDTIINRLLLQKNIVDATWDKCQSKVAIYPGHSTIGVVFKTKNNTVEKCFIVQEGTTGQPNIFGWRPKLFKSKMILKNKRMKECDGFVKEQKGKCNK